MDAYKDKHKAKAKAESLDHDTKKNTWHTIEKFDIVDSEDDLKLINRDNSE